MKALTPSGYATLAPARPSLARPSRNALHPSFFLAHVGAITVTSCLIPVIGARYSTSRAGEVVEEQQEEEPVVPPVLFNYPVQQPFPLKYQLFRLSNSLRRQIAATPSDAAFTLRQLHLVNQVPQLHLPDQTRPHPPSHDLVNFAPERWVWRLPAAAALHSILRLLSSPSSSSEPRLAETLLPIAVTIAQHSIRFDSLVWSTVLRARGHGNSLQWERLLEKEKATGRIEGEGLAEEPLAMTRLRKRPRERSSAPSVEAWEEGYRRIAGKARWTMPEADGKNVPGSTTPAVAAKTTPLEAPPFPPYLHPASSLSTRTLDRLFRHLASPALPKKNHPHASTALSLSLSLSALHRRRCLPALETSFSLALFHHRPDFAARFWADMYRETLLRGASIRQQRRLSHLLQRLSSVVRPEQRSFEAVPSRRVLAAVSILARTLDEVWAATVHGEEKPLTALGEVLRLLAAFPPAPPARGFVPARSARAKHAKRHERVGNMVKEVLRRVVEDIVNREVHVDGLKTVVGPALATEQMRRPLPLGIFDYNTLISFSLLKLQSPELAVLLLERMTESGLRPSPATHNIIFASLEAGSSSFADVLKRNISNQYTLPIFLSHMTRTASYDELEQIVFTLLPELDQRQSLPSAHPSPAQTNTTSPLAPASAPPLTGRTPYLYTTLLTCLVRSGRVGLAERVFRNARWAAERSREPLEPGGKARDGWVLPPHAYTVMLQLYAGEVTRGQQLEQRGAAKAEREEQREGEEQPLPSRVDDEVIDSLPSPFVRGWGRHALRVFLLQEQRAKLARESVTSPSATPAALSSFSESATYARRREHRTLSLPPLLRSEAAPIVAIWELEGGSKGPELESLRRAMASPQAQAALRILFPTKNGGSGAGGRGTSALLRARDDLRELGRRRWRIGMRAGKDEGRERLRARGEAARRREVVRKLKREEEAARARADVQ
ncbi:hypothetical protein JCM11251_000577 [Rhodosporidiobolus azoricus]